MSTLQQKVSEFDRNVNSNTKEYAGYTQDGEKTNNRAYYKGNCDHCGFYGHKMSDCKRKKKGLPMATDEQKKKRNLYCKISQIYGFHNTENHKDKEKYKEKKKRVWRSH